MENSVFRIKLAKLGGGLDEFYINNVKISGEKSGALFCCPMIFSRLPENSIHYSGNTYKIEFPQDREAIHGLTLNYEWEMVNHSDTHIRLELSKKKLPVDFPFPHSSFIEYKFGNRDLVIKTGIFDCERDTPAVPTIHPMFRYYTPGYSTGPKLRAELSSRFDYPESSPFPISFESPILLNENPFLSFTELTPTFDHSFIGGSVTDILWPDGISLRMIDETPEEFSPIKPIQIWSSAPDYAFAIEQGGPSNLFWLSEYDKVPKSWLPICRPGMEIYRKVRYQTLPSKNSLVEE